ncbi:MAG: hypothetical protein JSS56_01715 [Proteobacteria bacterium]|nr:hypothetical protein [Pseudomonadota bacterium]
MSKLLRLREWLTVEEAARHLSIMFGEEVSEADVLRLGLDGHLRLSVHFVNHANARRGRVSRYTREAMDAILASGEQPTDLEWNTLPQEWVTGNPKFPEAARERPVVYLASLNLDDERYLTLDDETTTIRGVWDLVMVGAECLDIEHKYQMLIGGPAVTLETLAGVFVQQADDEIWQVQERLDQSIVRGLREMKIDDLILRRGMTRADAQALVDRQSSTDPRPDYFPAGGLTDDAAVVVRTSAILELVQRSANHLEERPLGERERNTLYRIIGVLSRIAGLDLSKPSKAGSVMEDWASSVGISLAKRTAEEHLKKVSSSLEKL